MKLNFGVQQPCFFCLVLLFTTLILLGSLGVAGVSFGQVFSEQPLAILGKGKFSGNASFSPDGKILAIAGSIDREGGMLIASPAEDFITDAAMEMNHTLSAKQRRKQIGADRFRFISYPGWELVEEGVRIEDWERKSA